MKEKYPLFVKWYDALTLTFDLVEHMPKWIRATFNDRLLSISLGVLERIIQAIYIPLERKKELVHINTDLEILRVLWRLSVQKKWISLAQYEQIEQFIDETGRMVGGWQKKRDS